ncbi:unnamed protein product [Cuscuta europaea]|uniref:Transmembrane protein n=1 Tax=Cuscuta europaea TaxID=41803 RepID=A0A9P0ZMS0_CUSEU|nr:unnamed protein product [Cuscuta europaea]
MSQQFQPQIYPYNNVPTHPDSNLPSQSSASSSSSHSNGSYGMAFLVLGAILVLGVLACIANRLCSKRSNHHNNNDTYNNGHRHPLGKPAKPPADQHHQSGDLELGKNVNTHHSAKVGDASTTGGQIR